MRSFLAAGLLFALAAIASPPWQPADSARAETSQEKQAFDAAKELGTLEAWNAFLTNYPSGFHADLARAYMKKLGAGGEAQPSTPTAAPAAPPAPSATEISCSEARKLKSQRSSAAAQIRFVNESNATRVLQWIDFDGNLKEYGELAPGEERTQDTYLTHPWIAAYQEGSCRQLFLPGEGLTIARLLPDAASNDRTYDKPSYSKKKAARREENDHGATPEQTCRNIGQDYNGSQCVPRKKGPSKKTIEKRAAAACADIGMIYLNGKCAPKKKLERVQAQKNKNKACPPGMYRNPYGQCQPNETGG